MSEIETTETDPMTAPQKVLLTEEQIQTRIKELAEQIRADYGDEEVLLVGVLKGSFLFLADLCRHLGSNVTVDFMQVSSYGARTKSSGNVQLIKDLNINILDKHVLLVEDIVDSGLTLLHIRNLLGTRRPKSLKAISLLIKPECLSHDAQLEYVGFDIPNRFVVGYGLDYAEYFRNLPYIAQVQLQSEE